MDTQARVELRFRPFVVALISTFWAVVPSAAAQVQNEPITEPRAQQKPAPTVAKGAAAITQRHESCATRLIVNADALFTPQRWTLNPDARQTLDVLGSMILKAGKHSVRIVAFTAAADAAPENVDVSHRRAITVRTWLVNHQFVPPDTHAVGFSSSGMSEQAAAVPMNQHRQKNGTVEIVIETCKPSTP